MSGQCINEYLLKPTPVLTYFFLRVYLLSYRAYNNLVTDYCTEFLICFCEIILLKPTPVLTPFFYIYRGIIGNLFVDTPTTVLLFIFVRLYLFRMIDRVV